MFFHLFVIICSWIVGKRNCPDKYCPLKKYRDMYLIAARGTIQGKFFAPHSTRCWRQGAEVLQHAHTIWINLAYICALKVSWSLTRIVFFFFFRIHVGLIIWCLLIYVSLSLSISKNAMKWGSNSQPTDQVFYNTGREKNDPVSWEPLQPWFLVGHIWIWNKNGHAKLQLLFTQLANQYLYIISNWHTMISLLIHVQALQWLQHVRPQASNSTGRAMALSRSPRVIGRRSQTVGERRGTADLRMYPEESHCSLRYYEILLYETLWDTIITHNNCITYIYNYVLYIYIYVYIYM